MLDWFFLVLFKNLDHSGAYDEDLTLDMNV